MPKPHKVISPFSYGGAVVEAGGMWTPPDDGTAAKYIKAKCLAELSAQDITRNKAAAIDAAAEPEEIPKARASKKVAKKTRRRSFLGK